MEILYPMFGMIALSCFVVILLYATRVPSIFKMWGNLQHAKHADELRPNLPLKLRYITDNYNHIFEQPTLFYAVVIYIFLMEHTDNIHVYLAWGYVATRVIHTAIQLTTNNVSWRATIFSISGLCLIAMIVKESLFFI